MHYYLFITAPIPANNPGAGAIVIDIIQFNSILNSQLIVIFNTEQGELTMASSQYLIQTGHNDDLEQNAKQIPANKPSNKPTSN